MEFAVQAIAGKSCRRRQRLPRAPIRLRRRRDGRRRGSGRHRHRFALDGGVGQQIDGLSRGARRRTVERRGVTLTLAPSGGFRLDDVQPLAPCVLSVPWRKRSGSLRRRDASSRQHLVFSFAMTPLSEGAL